MIDVGVTSEGRVALRDEASGRAWFLSIGAAEAIAAALETLAAQANDGKVELEVSDAHDAFEAFVYTGSVDDAALMVRQLREMAAQAKPWLAEAGHA